MRGWHAAPSFRPQTGTLSTAPQATQVTGGAANTKGTWTALGATPATDWGFVTASLIHWDAEEDTMLDIGQGDGTTGGTCVLLPDLHFPANSSSSTLLAGNGAFTVPLRIKGGTALYARTANAGATHRHNVGVRGGPGLLGQPGFGQCVTLFTPASSRGVTIDPGATANTLGSWTSMTTGVAKRVGAFFLRIGTAGDVARTAMNWLVQVGAGASGSQVVVADGLPLSCANALPGLWPNTFGPFPCDVAASTAWWVRAQCSATTAGDRTFDVSLYGLVP